MVGTTTMIAIMATATAANAYSARQTRKAQEEAQEVSSNVQQNRAAQERRRLARQARVRRAQMEQAAVHSGVEGSSGAAAGLGGVASWHNQANSFLNTQQIAATAIGASNQRVADAQFRQQIVGELGNFAISASQLPGAPEGPEVPDPFSID